jgi:asparagine synthase (glutamine-hydrolysing)
LDKIYFKKGINDLLPESIVWRKNKFGFESPDRIWLSKYNDQMIKEIKNSNVLLLL